MEPQHAAQPEPPSNVRAVYRDGREVPLECRYEGLDDEGIHLWVAVAPTSVDLEAMESLRVDRFPAHTAISVEIADTDLG